MKTIKLLIVIFIFTMVSNSAFSTAQYPDYLIYQGDTLKLFSNPLEKYLEQHEKLHAIIMQYGYKNTGCWRGYVAYWKLKNNKLYLTAVMGDNDKLIDLSLLFKGYRKGKEIFADWVSGDILNPYGKEIYYIHDHYLSIYEYERYFLFTNGILTSIKVYDNSKSKRCIYTSNGNYGNMKLLHEYFSSHINYSNIHSEIKAPTRIIVRIDSVSDEGKIIKASVYRNQGNEMEQEAIRVVKSIPEWDVLYRHGKRINMPWSIPVTFEKRDKTN